jgi:type IV secretion system protein VirB10
LQQQTSQPTAEQRRIAEAYGRELQAIAAPTVIRGNLAGSSLRQYESPVGTAGEPSPLAALAELLTPKTGTPSDATTRRPTDREYEEQNMQAQKEAFLAQVRKSAGSGYLPSTRVQPLSEYEIKAGWEIPAVLEQEMNSDLPGELKALVTANVYDTATGRYLLIPQGARLVGTYDSNVAYGQNGLQVVWHRVIYPDASSVDLGGMTGQDARGSSGFRGDVDNHYRRLIGFAALTSLFSAGFQLSQPNRSNILQNPSAGEIAAGAVGQEISQLGSQITRRNLNNQPTIKIPIGYKFNVRVNRDILFDGPYPGGSIDR